MLSSEKSEITSRLLIKNSIINFIGQAITLPAVILTFPYIVHHLGAAKFGIFALLRVLVDYFGVCELGLGGATTKYIAEARERNEVEKIVKIYKTSATFIFVFGLIGALVFYFSVPFLAKHFLKVEKNLLLEMQVISRIGSSLVFVILAKSFFNGILEAYQRFDLINIIKIPYFIIISIIPVIAIFLGYGLVGVVVGIVSVELVTLIEYYLFSKKLIPNREAKLLSLGSFAPILSFGWWLSAARMISWAMVNIQNIIIGSLISVAAVTYYSIPYNLVNKMAIIGASVTPIVFSAMSFLYSRNKERTPRLVAYSLRYTMILYGLPSLVCICFSKEILILWLGSDFQQSIAVMKILAIGMFSCGFAWMLGTFIQSIGKPKLISLIGFFQFPLDILATFFLTKRLGILGAALAWTCLRILTTLIFYLICSRFNIYRASLKFNKNFLFGSGYFLLLIILISTLKYFSPISLLHAGFNILILIAGYSFIMWRYSIEETHKALLINRIWKKI